MDKCIICPLGGLQSLPDANLLNARPNASLARGRIICHNHSKMCLQYTFCLLLVKIFVSFDCSMKSNRTSVLLLIKVAIADKQKKHNTNLRVEISTAMSNGANKIRME